MQQISHLEQDVQFSFLLWVLRKLLTFLVSVCYWGVGRVARAGRASSLLSERLNSNIYLFRKNLLKA